MNTSKVIIKEEKLSEWIITEKVLSFAVEGIIKSKSVDWPRNILVDTFFFSRSSKGNIDQSQYCEKIKTIVEFIGDRIKSEEIRALWEMQVIEFS